MDEPRRQPDLGEVFQNHLAAFGMVNEPSARTYTLDEVLQHFGITQEDLDAIPDEDDDTVPRALYDETVTERDGWANTAEEYRLRALRAEDRSDELGALLDEIATYTDNGYNPCRPGDELVWMDDDWHEIPMSPTCRAFWESRGWVQLTPDQRRQP